MKRLEFLKRAPMIVGGLVVGGVGLKAKTLQEPQSPPLYLSTTTSSTYVTGDPYRKEGLREGPVIWSISEDGTSRMIQILTCPKIGIPSPTIISKPAKEVVVLPERIA